MDIEQIEKELNEWAEQINATDKAISAFTELCGGDLDSKLLRPFCQMQSEYTAAVGKLVGDENGRLSYFWLECDMGKNALRVNGKKLKNISQLAALIHNIE